MNFLLSTNDLQYVVLKSFSAAFMYVHGHRDTPQFEMCSQKLLNYSSSSYVVFFFCVCFFSFFFFYKEYNGKN